VGRAPSPAAFEFGFDCDLVIRGLSPRQRRRARAPAPHKRATSRFGRPMVTNRSQHLWLGTNSSI